MKIIVRCAVFETNSSTCHSFAYLDKKTYDEWKKKQKYIYLPNDYQYDFWKLEDNEPKEGILYSEEEVKEFVEAVNEIIRDAEYNFARLGFVNYEEYVYSDDITLQEPSEKYTLTRTYHD